MPWAAPAIGVGVCSIWQRARVRVPLVVLLLYAVLFQLVVLWSQFTLFTGCAVKGDDKYFKFSAPAFCLDQAQVMLDRLAVTRLACLGFCWLLWRVELRPTAVHSNAKAATASRSCISPILLNDARRRRAHKNRFGRARLKPAPLGHAKNC